MDILMYILAGAGVGFAVGITGVGGGSLMTPLLLLFGFPAHIAVGTDLLYAAITKSGGVLAHKNKGTIHWKIVFTLGIGSITASLLTIFLLKHFFTSPEDYTKILTSSLGAMLIATALVLIFRRQIQQAHDTGSEVTPSFINRHKAGLTLTMGFFLGIFVTLSSVGAGAFGAALLMVLYPRIPSIQVIGTDLAHAVPLTLVAGIGHLALGHVDFALLAALITGSLPAIYLGTKLAIRIPDQVLQPILACTLLGLGIKYSFF